MEQEHLVYMDNCCYNRLFDNREVFRNYVERDAVRYILLNKVMHNMKIIGSDMLVLEMLKNPDKEKKYAVWDTYISYCDVMIWINKEIINRAKEIVHISDIKERDAVHIAAAEAVGAKLLFTTDEKLRKNANRITINTTVINPIAWLKEEMRKWKC